MLRGPRAWTSCPTLPLGRSSIKIKIDEPKKDLIGFNSVITLSPLRIQKSFCIFDLMISGLSQLAVSYNCFLSILWSQFRTALLPVLSYPPFLSLHCSSHNKPPPLALPILISHAHWPDLCWAPLDCLPCFLVIFRQNFAAQPHGEPQEGGFSADENATKPQASVSYGKW